MKQPLLPIMWILKRGDLFDRRYRIEREIGAGGMSYVYAVLDEELHETVALKVIRPELVGDEELVERFKREVRIARQIHHPNIIRIFELGRVVLEERNIYYLTMELLSGLDLGAWIRRRGRISLGDTLQIALQMCDALSEAHRTGVIHRDIKPQNIFIDDQGRVKLVDFGISRLATLTGLTRGSQFMGTPKYMSPEQVTGRGDLDHRSDLYSLGVVLYELSTQRVPFEGQTPVEVALRHIQEAPDPPRTINAQMPEALEKVILTCLEKDPNARYATADEIRMALLGIVQDAEAETLAVPVSVTTAPQRAKAIVTSPTPGKGAQARPKASQTDVAPPPTTRRRKDLVPGVVGRRRSALVWLGAGSLAALLGVVGYFVWLMPPPGEKPSQPTEAETLEAEASPASAPDQVPEPEVGEASAPTPAPEPPTRETTVAIAETPSVTEVTPTPPKAVPVPGTVTIAANPGTSIYIDGDLVGTIPPVVRRELPAGEHQIRYVIPEYDEFEETVEVVGGRENRFSHHFPPFGALRVVCRPYASARLDGEEAGFTPLNIRRVRAGDHRLVLYREGYQTVAQSITVQAGKVNLFRFSLVQR